MKLDDTDFALLAVFLEGFFCGTISVLQTSRPWIKQSNTALPRIGLNSGIFALYLYESKKNARTGNILLYTLCALYVLSFAGFVLDITYVYVTASVSNISANNNDHIFQDPVLISFSVTRARCQYIVPLYNCHFSHNKWWLRLHLSIYRSTYEPCHISFTLFTQIFQDLPLLDCMGLQHPCRNHSFNLRIHILRSVNLSSITS
jgi:hypothetical protein